MLKMKNTCCCCEGTLLKHVKQDEVYWYCADCHQEMPNLNLISSTSTFDKYKQKREKDFPTIN